MANPTRTNLYKSPHSGGCVRQNWAKIQPKGSTIGTVAAAWSRVTYQGQRPRREAGRGGRQVPIYRSAAAMVLVFSSD